MKTFLFALLALLLAGASAQAQRLEIQVAGGLAHIITGKQENRFSPFGRSYLNKEPFGSGLGLGVGWVWRGANKVYVQYQRQLFTHRATYIQDFLPQASVFIRDVRLRDRWHLVALGYARKLAGQKHQFWAGGGVYLSLRDPQELQIASLPGQPVQVFLDGLGPNSAAKVSYEVDGGVHVDLAYEHVINERVSVGVRGQVFYSIPIEEFNKTLFPFITVRF